MPKAAGVALLIAHHEDGAVGVPDDGFGDAAHQRPAYRAQAPAADYYEARAELLGQAEDLFIRLPASQVGLGQLTAVRPDLLRPLLAERPALPLGRPDNGLPRP